MRIDREVSVPLVQVSFIEGPGADAKRRLIEGLTATVVEELAVPREAVSVLLTEVPASHWGRGGTSLDEILGEGAGSKTA